MLHTLDSLAAYDREQVSAVPSLIESGVDAGDIGVQTATHKDALAMLAVLRAAGIEGIELESDTGLAAPFLEIGTIERAKGLEFKKVVPAHVDGSLLAPDAEGFTDNTREARGSARRGLCVGITRARHQLWVGARLATDQI